MTEMIERDTECGSEWKEEEMIKRTEINGREKEVREEQKDRKRKR